MLPVASRAETSSPSPLTERKTVMSPSIFRSKMKNKIEKKRKEKKARTGWLISHATRECGIRDPSTNERFRFLFLPPSFSFSISPPFLASLLQEIPRRHGNYTYTGNRSRFHE